MIQSAMAPGAMWKVMVDLHNKFISPTEARVLALVAQGYTNEEVASLLDTTPGTVRRHVAGLCHRIFDATDIPAEREKLRTWIEHHAGCCSPLVQEMIENDRKTRIGSE